MMPYITKSLKLNLLSKIRAHKSYYRKFIQKQKKKAGFHDKLTNQAD